MRMKQNLKKLVTLVTLAAVLIGVSPVYAGAAGDGTTAQAVTSTDENDARDDAEANAAGEETTGSETSNGVEEAPAETTESSSVAEEDSATAEKESAPEEDAAASAKALSETPSDTGDVTPAEDSSLIWVNDDTGTTFDTLSVAVDAAANGATVHMRGIFESTAVSNAVVGKGITLEIAGDTTITGTNGKGFTLSDGAKLTAAGGAALTMTGFSDAITVNSGSVIADGTYNISDVNNGFVLNGTGKIEGSSRDNLHLTVTAKTNQVGFATTNRTDASAGIDDKYPNFVNATVIVNAGRVDGWTYRAVVADNAHVELSDIWLYSSNSNPLLIKNHSYFKISGRFNQNSWRGGHVLSVYQDIPAKFVDSTVVVDGSRINVAGGQPLYVENSDVTVQNSPDGGININYGNSVYFNNSTLRGVNVRRALIGAGNDRSSNLYFSGSSVVETNAASTNDAIGVNGSFVVTGGSYKTYIAGSNVSNQTPTNGTDNGNEKLTLFQLSNPSVSSLSPINVNGETYTYPVAKANDDGTKRVWVPKTTLTFRLMNQNATFADGTTDDQSFPAIRGETIGAFSQYVDGSTWTPNNFQMPGNPMDSTGTRFLGWYYRDANGTEHEFNAETTRVLDNMLVYAKWEGSSLVYHNNGSDTVARNLPLSQTSVTAETFEDIADENAAFRVAGKTFSGWNTAPNGTGTAYQPGDTIEVTPGSQIDLYAQYEDVSYTVKFSANGGQFSADSVYQNTDYFTIEKDANGGEVAVLKKQATYGQTLHDLTTALGLDYNQLKPDTNASFTGFSLADAVNWYQTKAGTDSIRFDDYTILGVFPVSGTNPAIQSDVTYYLKWQSAADKDNTTTADGTLPADMWSGTAADGTEENSTAITNVADKDAVTVTGAVDVSSIKEQMQQIAENFGMDADQYAGIGINGAQSTFTATMTLPEGIRTPEASDLKAEAEGLGDCFDLSDQIAVDAQNGTVTVTFSLKDGMTDFRKLYDAVNSTGVTSDTLTPDNADTILITVSGLQVDGDQLNEGDTFNISGAVNGSFSGYAYMKAAETSAVRTGRAVGRTAAASAGQAFQFTWNAVQKAGLSSDGDALAATYRYYKPLSLELPGDITTDGATDSKAIRSVTEGDSLTYNGRLDVQSIKEQIDTLKRSFGVSSEEDAQTISLQEITSSFTTTIRFPEGLELPDRVIAGENVTFTDNNLFELRSAEKTEDGKGVIVTLDLKNNENKDRFTSFDQLETAVKSVPRILEMRVAGVTVADGLSDETILTAEGTVTGSFYGIATKGETTRVFSYIWNAIQSTAENSQDTETDEGLGDGQDENNSSPDGSITYTVRTAVTPTPTPDPDPTPTPDNPDEPLPDTPGNDDNNNPVTPTNPETPSTPKTPSTPETPSTPKTPSTPTTSNKSGLPQTPGTGVTAPRTGDTAPIAGFAVTLLAASVVLVVLLRKRKNNQ